MFCNVDVWLHLYTPPHSAISNHFIQYSIDGLSLSYLSLYSVTVCFTVRMTNTWILNNEVENCIPPDFHFLGYITENQGVQMDDHKVAAVV